MFIENLFSFITSQNKQGHLQNCLKMHFRDNLNIKRDALLDKLTAINLLKRKMEAP